MLDLPLDILYLINGLVGRLPHPFSYIIDTATLHSLCLVSRSFNAWATPILYSSIALYSQHSVGCLLMTAKSNPRLLGLCHSICWPGWRLRFVEQQMLSAMAGLRRFATTQASWRPIDFLPVSTMVELAFPGITLEVLCRPSSFHQYTFSNLERLVVKSILFRTGAHATEAFCNTPRLTHLAITALNAKYLHPEREDFDDIVTTITHTPQLRRVTFGLIEEDVGGLEYNGFQSKITERLPEHFDVHVVVLVYSIQCKGIWWDHIVEGTLWETDTEHQIEVFG